MMMSLVTILEDVDMEGNMLLETFINGIEVLDKTEIWDMSLLGRATIIIVMVIVSLIGSFITGGEHPVTVGIISVVIAIIIGCSLYLRPTGKYEYKVTIDDTVSLTEFTEKYEITDQEGKIYTIRIKE